MTAIRWAVDKQPWDFCGAKYHKGVIEKHHHGGQMYENMEEEESLYPVVCNVSLSCTSTRCRHV